MNCLKDHIGLTGVYDTPESGLFVNQVAGLSTYLMDKIYNPSDSDVNTMWDNIQLVCQKRIYHDVINKLRMKYKIKRAVEYARLQFLYDDSTTVSVENEYGVILKLADTGLTFQSFLINDVYFRNEAGVTSVTINIYDEKYNLLYTKLYEGVSPSGWVTLPVNERFSALKILITIPVPIATTLAVTEIDEASSTCYCSTINSICDGSVYDYLNPSVKGVMKDGTTITEGDDTFGVGVAFSFGCDYSSIVCYNKDLFTMPLMYCLAAEILLRQRVSERINQLTTVTIDEAEQLRQIFISDYEKTLNDAIEGLSISPNDDPCFDCKENAHSVQWLP